MNKDSVITVMVLFMHKVKIAYRIAGDILAGINCGETAFKARLLANLDLAICKCTHYPCVRVMY